MAEYRLPEQLDIRNIADIQRELVAALPADGARLIVDAEGVARIDTAGVQLLAAGLSDHARGVLLLIRPAAAVTTAFTALGLSHLLKPE